MKEIIIFGAGKIAEVVFDYVTQDSDLRVTAFCVDAAFRQSEQFLGLPLIAFEEAPRLFKPSAFDVLLGVGYHECNHLRRRTHGKVEAAGYRCASYRSSRAWIAASATIGEGSIILDHVSIEPKATIGCNTMLWSHTVVGHHAQVGNHVWAAAGSVIGGGAKLGDGCFLGLSASVGHEVTLGERCLVGANSFVGKDAVAGSVLLCAEAIPHRLDVDYFLKLSGKL
jgi:sugar O-acyltransferase (sialic acid O-acetyltransferase NeuD family)